MPNFKLLLFTLSICLVDFRSTFAFWPSTVAIYNQPPASKELIAQSRKILDLEIKQDHGSLLEAKIALLEMIRTADDRRAWNVKLLEREILSLRTFIPLSQPDKAKIHEAINLALQFDRYLDGNNSSQALKLLHDQIETVERLCGRHYVQIERLKYIEASALAGFDRFDEALAMCKEVEDSSPEIDDVMLPEEIRCAFLRSWIHHKQGNSSLAANWYQRAVAAHKQLLADAATRTGIQYENFLIHAPILRSMYDARGRYVEAAAVSEYQEPAVEAVLGNRSREFAFAVMRTAQELGGAGDFKRMIEKTRRAVDLAQGFYVRGDYEYRQLILLAANELCDSGQYKEAKPLYDIVESEAKAAGHAGDQIRALVGLSDLASKSGDPQLADALSAKAVEQLEKLPTAGTQFRIDVWECRAKALRATGNLQAAIAVMNSVIDMSKSTDFMAPHGHRNTALLLEQRYEMRLQSGEIEAAKLDLSEAIEILDKTVGKGHPHRTRVAAILERVR